MIIGIDPGKSGFITCFSDSFTHYAIPKIGDEVDLSELNKIFASFPKDSFAVIEDVHAIYGSSAGATFEFGWVTGILEALLVAHSISFQKITPKVWQKAMLAGIPLIKKAGKKTNNVKLMSEMACKRLFPDLDLRRNDRCTKLDDNKIDSILICEYARRMLISDH